MPSKSISPLHRILLSLTAGLAVLLIGAAAPGTLPSAAPRGPAVASRFQTPPNIIAETVETVGRLAQGHLNRLAVTPAQYSKAIEEYMNDRDPFHLFFLASDKTELMQKHGTGSTLYYNLTRSGNLDAAYDIFSVYARRVENRVAWIREELAKPFDFTGTDTYAVDRSKSPYPATSAEADELWRRRLKYELLQEILNHKTVTLRGVNAQGQADPAAVRTVTVINRVSTDAGLSKELKDALAADAPVTISDQKLALELDAALRRPPGDKSKVDALSPTASIDEAKEVVAKRYNRRLEEIPKVGVPEIAEGFLTAVAQLYDPHSSYLSGESYEEFEIQIRLELVGIGAQLRLNDDLECVIDQLIKGGPAERSGQIGAGDKIIAVAQATGEPVEVIGEPLRKTVQLIRGERGTDVRLIIQPKSPTEPRREIVLKRDVVKLNDQRAHATVYELPDGRGATAPIGVITVPAFYGDSESPEGFTASKDVAQLLTQLKAVGVEGVVLDLRRNGGGLLREAVNLAGLFISRGPVVQVKMSSNDVQVDSDVDPRVTYSGPLTVLVDRFSASASEIVAGALQNYGRAVVIGDSSTHGKGTVQALMPLTVNSGRRVAALMPDKPGAVKLTIQKFYLPNGSSTQRKGVIPDIVLPSALEYLPNIGEKDLPNALVYDEIPSATFDRIPMDSQSLAQLAQMSRSRQQQLPEFAYLTRAIDWFKSQQDILKAVPLNLQARQREKSVNADLSKTMKAQFKELEKSSYASREFRLVPRDRDPATDEADDELIPGIGPNEEFDIGLRESLRVLGDILTLNRRTAGGPGAIAVFRPRNS